MPAQLLASENVNVGGERKEMDDCAAAAWSSIIDGPALNTNQ